MIWAVLALLAHLMATWIAWCIFMDPDPETDSADAHALGDGAPAENTTYHEWENAG